MSEEKAAVDLVKAEVKLEGLGGWLILVGIGIVVSPLRTILQLAPLYKGIFFEGSWEILTTPGSAAYHALWAPLLIGELVLNVALCMTWGYIAYLFFTRKSVFPKWYIGILIFTLAFILTDALATHVILPDEATFDPDTIKELARTLIAMAIWIPYMLVSKRVKATFVK